MNPGSVNNPSGSHPPPDGGQGLMIRLKVDGNILEAIPGEPLLELLNRSGVEIPQVCYHPQLGPIQTCDTCMVESNGHLVRACTIRVEADMNVATSSARASQAQREAFDRILAEHMLYCTVCDNKNCLPSSISGFLSSPSLTRWTRRTRFIDTIPVNAFCAGGASKLARMCKSMKP